MAVGVGGRGGWRETRGNRAHYRIENKVAVYPRGQSFFEIREAIMMTVADKLAAGHIPVSNQEFLRMAIVVEGKYIAFKLLVKTSGDGLNLNIAVIEQLLMLYENCQRFCEFLIDAYDTAPDYFKSKASKDSLSEAAVDLENERVEAQRNFVEKDAHKLQIKTLATIQILIYLTMLFLLGEEFYYRMLAEVNDALEIVAAHPDARELFEQT